MKKKNAILILEAPWELSESDQNTVSVLPFFQGLERLRGNFDLFHSHFYEAKSFKMALDNLTRVQYERCYVYIACHGDGKRLHHINLANALKIIQTKAKQNNILGVVIGSCLVGNNTDILGESMTNSPIVWKFGYRCEVNWLDGTLMDLEVFDALLKAREPDFSDENAMLRRFQSAFRHYAPHAVIGNHPNGEDCSIAEGVSLVIQARGQGHVPMDYSECLFDDDCE
ncbi:hypothetical protein ACRN9T_04690 [Shewanella baltica]|uniref:hypothetical protein n=1 Tax=Shewanella baltica TaxID=62322 RepID=UPI003D79254C